MFAATGGVHSDWIAGATSVTKVLAERFRPQVVWGIFGSTSNLVLAQQLARRSGAHWFMDLKDNWDLYVPPGLRRLTAYRFRNAAGFTSNARFHGDLAARWHRQPHAIIYSSIAREMIAPKGMMPRRDVFNLTLIGGTYQTDKLAGFLAALNGWLGTLAVAERAMVEFHYAGTAVGDVGKAVAASPLECRTSINGPLSHAALAELCHAAAANCYIWFPMTFHHKLLELIACRRPVISFPGEHEESKELARKVGGELAACGNESELIDAFDHAFRRWQAGDGVIASVDTSAFTWDAMAAKLEAFMLGMVEKDRMRGNAVSTAAIRRSIVPVRWWRQ
jgi:hypothetical protein